MCLLPGFLGIFGGFKNHKNIRFNVMGSRHIIAIPRHCSVSSYWFSNKLKTLYGLLTCRLSYSSRKVCCFSSSVRTPRGKTHFWQTYLMQQFALEPWSQQRKSWCLTRNQRMIGQMIHHVTSLTSTYRYGREIGDRSMASHAPATRELQRRPKIFLISKHITATLVEISRLIYPSALKRA